MTEEKIVLYGASGYTGKEVARILARRQIPFVAAGRNGERLKAQLQALPELRDADYRVEQVEHEEAALAKLLKGASVVHNLVGPYMQLGEPVVRAALASGCHYLDATGEQDWMLHLRKTYAGAFAEKGLILAPATASMWTSGALIAELALETPGLDSLDILYTLQGVPSVSSTLSFMRMCCQPQYYLQNNALVSWPPAASVNVAPPGLHRVLKAVPWSGGGESVWFADDPRVRNCSTLVTFHFQQLMDLVTERMREFNDQYKDRPSAEQEAATNAWAMEIAPQGEPLREDWNVHRNLFSVHARGTLASRSIALWGVTGYVMTAGIGVAAIDAILSGRADASGFVPAVKIVGARRLLAELQAEGVYGKPVDLIRT